MTHNSNRVRPRHIHTCSVFEHSLDWSITRATLNHLGWPSSLYIRGQV